MRVSVRQGVAALAVCGVVTCGNHLDAASPIPASASNCSLAEPPRDAGEDFTHTATEKIYPRLKDMPKDYTGCQSVWLESAGGWTRMSTTFFRNGEPVIFEGFAVPRVCLYENKRLREGPPDSCPSPRVLANESMPSGCLARIKQTGKRPPDCDYE